MVTPSAPWRYELAIDRAARGWLEQHPKASRLFIAFESTRVRRSGVRLRDVRIRVDAAIVTQAGEHCSHRVRADVSRVNALRSHRRSASSAGARRAPGRGRMIAPLRMPVYARVGAGARDVRPGASAQSARRHHASQHATHIMYNTPVQSAPLGARAQPAQSVPCVRCSDYVVLREGFRTGAPSAVFRNCLRRASLTWGSLAPRISCFQRAPSAVERPNRQAAYGGSAMPGQAGPTRSQPTRSR
jgi:hypothetical protein